MEPTHRVDLNLLPQRYRPQHLTLPLVLAIIFVAGAMLGTIPTYQVYRAKRAVTRDLQAQLDILRTALDAEGIDEEQLEELNERIQEVEAEFEQLQSELDTVRQWQSPRAPTIASVNEALLPRVHLVSITEDGETIAVTGETGSTTLVLDYARALQEREEFSDVRVVSVRNVDSTRLAPWHEFTFILEQTEQ